MLHNSTWEPKIKRISSSCPRHPTIAMLKAGWYEAHDENALGVWRDVIEAWESTLEDRELGQGQRQIPSLPEL